MYFFSPRREETRPTIIEESELGVTGEPPSPDDSDVTGEPHANIPAQATKPTQVCTRTDSQNKEVTPYRK